MNPFDFISLMPDPLKRRIADSLVDFLANQAEKMASEQIANKIRALSSQAEFARALDQAIKTGAQRFVAQYTAQDEDLVAAITADESFWDSPSIQEELVTMIRRPGAWLPGEREVVTLHFEDVLPQRINRERVDRAVTFFLRCVVEELWTLPGAKEIRDVYALQFQKITAEATREQVALARQQIEATLQLGAGVREALLQLTSAMEKNLLAAPAALALPQPRPYHNLPQPDYARFVGRERELAWLRQRLSPADRAWQIAITGIGGVGKSALAMAIAHEYRQQYDQLPPEERFEAIIWVSAKEEVLTAHGREQAALPELVLRTLEDVYTAIARALDREDITRAVPEDQGRLVEKALQEQRTLLIMDNLESVKDDRIKPFLRALPAPTKAIITSREWLDVADVLSLKGLSDEEAEVLIIEEAAVRQVNLDAAQRRRLFDLTAGLPLPIKLGVARISGGESFAAVTRWLGDATGDLPEYCIAGQADLARRRNPDAWRLLLACSLFDRGAGASREALGYVADLSLADRDSGLAHLQRLFLVNCTEHDRFWVLPIVQRYASVQFTVSDFGSQLIDRWLGWLASFAQDKGTNLEWQIELIEEFSQEYPNLLNAIRWCRDQERWNELIVMAEASWAYPYLRGLFHEFQEILDATSTASLATNNESMKGRIELQTARLAVIQSKSEAIITHHLDKAEEIARRYDHAVDLGETWATRIDLLGSKERLSEAQGLAQALLEKGEQAGNLKLMWLGADRLAYVVSKQGDFEQAFQLLDRAEEFARKLRSSRQLAGVMNRRGTVLIRQGNFEQAEGFLLQALEMNTRWGGRRYVAYIKRRLAQIYQLTGRLHLARQAAEEAGEIFDRLGMEHSSKEMVGFLKKLSQQVSDNSKQPALLKS